MSHLRSFVSALSLVTAVGSLQAAPPLVRLLPEDAPLVFALNDVQDLVKSSEASPIVRMWNDPQVQRFLAPALEQLQWEKAMEEFKQQTGYTFPELLKMAKGEAIVGVVDFAFLSDSEAQKAPPFIVAVDFGSDAKKIERLLVETSQKQKAEGKIQLETETYAGETLYVTESIPQKKDDDVNADEETPEKKREPVPFVWTSVDGVLLGSPSLATVKSTVDALKKGGLESSLERAPRYVRLQEQAPGHQMSMLVHFPSIVPQIEKAIAEKAGEQKQNPLGIDPTALLGALGLTDWQDLYFTGRVDEDAAINHYGLTYREERGILKIFGMGSEPFPRPSWIPAKWDTVSTARFSLKQMFAGLEETLRTLSPAMEGLAQGYLAQFGKQMNVDIKRDFFGSFGNEIVQSQFFGSPATGGAPDILTAEQFYALSLENAPALTRVIDGLKKLGGPGIEKMLVERDYLGRKIFVFTPPAGPDGNAPATTNGFAYAITDRYMLLNIGSAAPIEAALQTMANSGDSFWDKETTKAALARVPEDANSFQSQNVAVLISAVIETLAKIPPPPPTDPDDEADGASKFRFSVDASEKPSRELIERYWGGSVSYSRRDSTGLHGVSRLEYPKP